MKLIRILTIIAAGVSLSASALNPLPVDPDVLTGTLPNGLTYYIRHNDRPAGQADFYIAMRVGSVNEEENQRGLAHFLEHLCFNGTRHFPGNSLIEYLETIGVKFGANLNAYTSTDETVYNICQVPTRRQSALDSCLLILRDWSNDITFDPKEIDAERGVIEGEWRQRNGAASTRLLEKALPVVYDGNIYGYRMPIGSMDVVRNFKPSELRDYYEKWYHPLNQCVVVVGDIDPTHIKNEIERLWADVEAPAGATAFELPKIPGNASPIVSVQTDPEQSASSVQLFIKHDALPDSLTNTIAELRNSTVKSLIGSMLAERLTEVENEDDSPISATAIGDIRFLLSRSAESLTMRSPVKAGRTADAVKALATELKRASVHGFLPAEFQRAIIEARAANEKEYAARNSTTNTEYANAYVRHYLDGGALPSATQRYKMMKGVLSTVKLEDCNRYIASVVRPDNSNVVISAYLPSKDQTTQADLMAAYTGVKASALAPYEDKTVSGDILENEPEAGEIISEESLPRFGAKRLTLSNGIKVYLRPSAEKPDFISIQGTGSGGVSQNYDPKRGAEYRQINDILALSAAGKYTTDNLRRLLVGKNVKSSISIGNMDESVAATSTKADLADAFRLIYLKSTDLRQDKDAFNRYIDRSVAHLDDNRLNPTFAMGDSIHAYVYNRHPLGTKATAEGFRNIDYDKAMALYRERFGDMTDFSFFITGDFCEDSIRPLIAKYIASLPTAGRHETPRDINYRYGTSQKARFTMPMENKQSIVYSFYYSPCEFTLPARITAEITGTLLQNKLRQDLREERGWTYGVRTHIGLNNGYNGNDPSLAIMPVYIRVVPENAARTFEIVDSTMRAMAEPANIPATELGKIKEYMAKNHAEALKDNSYWASVMRVYDRYGVDMNEGYEKILGTVTPETVASFVSRILLPAQRLQLEMAPDN